MDRTGSRRAIYTLEAGCGGESLIPGSSGLCGVKDHQNDHFCSLLSPLRQPRLQAARNHDFRAVLDPQNVVLLGHSWSFLAILGLPELGLSKGGAKVSKSDAKVVILDPPLLDHLYSTFRLIKGKERVQNTARSGSRTLTGGVPRTDYPGPVHSSYTCPGTHLLGTPPCTTPADVPATGATSVLTPREDSSGLKRCS